MTSGLSECILTKHVAAHSKKMVCARIDGVAPGLRIWALEIGLTAYSVFQTVAIFILCIWSCVVASWKDMDTKKMPSILVRASRGLVESYFLVLFHWWLGLINCLACVNVCTVLFHLVAEKQWSVFPRMRVIMLWTLWKMKHFKSQYLQVWESRV